MVDRNLRGLFFRGDLVLFGLFSVSFSSQERLCGLLESNFCISSTPLRRSVELTSWIIDTLEKKKLLQLLQSLNQIG